MTSHQRYEEELDPLALGARSAQTASGPMASHQRYEDELHPLTLGA